MINKESKWKSELDQGTKKASIISKIGEDYTRHFSDSHSKMTL